MFAAPDPELVGWIETSLRREAVRSEGGGQTSPRGVAWSALGVERWAPRPSGVLKAEAASDLEARRAWRASREGRLLKAIAEAQRAAQVAHAVGERARASLNRDPQHDVQALVDGLAGEARALMAAVRAARRVLRGRVDDVASSRD
jgi:hypothetical protein